VGTTDAINKNEWYEDVKIAGKTVNVQLGINTNIKKPEAQLKSYSGHVITTKGVTTLPCEYKRKTYQVKFHVVDIPAPPEPTDWVNSMVTVIKPEKIRVCIDPRDLNRAIEREYYPMKTIEDVVAGMPEVKVFSVLDATSGYWQMKLNEESSKLCTFNKPFGRYRFTRLPFGIKSAPEVFQKKMSQVLEDIDGAEAIVDDILVWGKDIQEHDARLKKVLDRVQAVNLKLNQKKCQIRKEEIPYVGHLLTKDGLKPDPEKIRACASHDQTIQHERVKNISWVYPISRKVFTQYGRSQCTTSKVAGKGHSIALGKATR
jgi:hypothetical protein